MAEVEEIAPEQQQEPSEAPSGEGLPNELRVGNDAMAITIALNGLRATLAEHTTSMVELVEAALVVLRDDADERNTRLIHLVTGEIGDLRQSVNEILDPPNDADSYGGQSSREREERS